MDRQTIGILLIMLGLFMFIGRTGAISGEHFLLVLGAGLITTYYLTGYRTGFLIGGTVVSAVGIHALVQTKWNLGIYEGPLFFTLLGLSMALVYIVEAGVGNNSQWAIYPSAGFIGFAFFILLAEKGLVDDYIHWWPLGLIVAGIWLMIGSQKKKAR